MDRQKLHRIIILVWLGAFFLLGIGVWGLQSGYLLVLIFFSVSTLAYAIYAITARCPKCGTPILLKPMNLFGLALYCWSLVAPSHCKKCNESL